MKLSKINNALEQNWEEWSLYKVHDLRKKTIYFSKRSASYRTAQKTQSLFSFFSDTAVTHIFPIIQGITSQKPWKKHFRPFLTLSNHFISDTKMSLCYYMDPEGVMKFDSTAK